MNSLEVVLDHSRRERIGLDEAIFAAGKSTAQLLDILVTIEGLGERTFLTRLTQAQFEELPAIWRERIDYDAISETGCFGPPLPAKSSRRIAVVTAGASDMRVALEAIRTLRYAGEICQTVFDVGVSGLWRLLERLELLRDKTVVIVVAGMDAALPSVIGGLVGGVVIAVPTSTGYGVANGGMTALHSALSSCAPGITVVNIDNGYGAACAALRVINGLQKAESIR